MSRESQFVNHGFFTFETETITDRYVTLLLYYPHEYMKPLLTGMSIPDRQILQVDLKVWIAKSQSYTGVMARSYYGIPGREYILNTSPEDVTDMHNFLERYGESGDRFIDHGKRIAKTLYGMIKIEILQGNKNYFLKYHDLICFQKCRTREQCIDRRMKLNYKYGSAFF